MLHEINATYVNVNLVQSNFWVKEINPKEKVAFQNEGN